MTSKQLLKIKETIMQLDSVAMQANTLIDAIIKLRQCKIFTRCIKSNYGKPPLSKLKWHLMEVDKCYACAEELEEMLTILNEVRNSYPIEMRK